VDIIAIYLALILLANFLRGYIARKKQLEKAEAMRLLNIKEGLDDTD
jgi:hypothetical protein